MRRGTWTPMGFLSVKLTSRYTPRNHISVGVGNRFRSQGPGLWADRETCETPYRRNGGFRRLRQRHSLVLYPRMLSASSLRDVEEHSH
jgi:hypothetical protein